MAYGVALDIGTTTVSGTLLDLEKRIVKKRFSSLNSQISYGHDIISRINYVLRKRNGLKRLNRSIISSINFRHFLTSSFRTGSYLNYNIDSLISPFEELKKDA